MFFETAAEAWSVTGAREAAGVLGSFARAGVAERAKCEERGILVAGDDKRAREPGNLLALVLPFFEESGVRGNWRRIWNGSFGRAETDPETPEAGVARACCCCASDPGAAARSLPAAGLASEDGKDEFAARLGVGAPPFALSFHVRIMATTAAE